MLQGQRGSRYAGVTFIVCGKAFFTFFLRKALSSALRGCHGYLGRRDEWWVERWREEWRLGVGWTMRGRWLGEPKTPQRGAFQGGAGVGGLGIFAQRNFLVGERSLAERGVACSGVLCSVATYAGLGF